MKSLHTLDTTIKADHGPTCIAVGLWGSELLLASLASQDCLFTTEKKSKIEIYRISNRCKAKHLL